MNFIHIVGRIGKEPDTRFTTGGQKVTTLLVATNSFKNNQEETMWWRVTMWGDRHDKLIPHLTKGKPIMIGGELKKPELYTDKSGNVQIGSLEITAEYVKFVPFNKNDQEGNTGERVVKSSQGPASSPQPAKQFQGDFPGFEEEESTVPF